MGIKQLHHEFSLPQNDLSRQKLDTKSWKVKPLCVSSTLHIKIPTSTCQYMNTLSISAHLQGPGMPMNMYRSGPNPYGYPMANQFAGQGYTQAYPQAQGYGFMPTAYIPPRNNQANMSFYPPYMVIRLRLPLQDLNKWTCFWVIRRQSHIEAQTRTSSLSHPCDMILQLHQSTVDINILLLVCTLHRWLRLSWFLILLMQTMSKQCHASISLSCLDKLLITVMIFLECVVTVWEIFWIQSKALCRRINNFQALLLRQAGQASCRNLGQDHRLACCPPMQTAATSEEAAMAWGPSGNSAALYKPYKPIQRSFWGDWDHKNVLDGANLLDRGGPPSESARGVQYSLNKWGTLCRKNSCLITLSQDHGIFHTNGFSISEILL